MKHFKRILSITLAMILLFTGLEIPLSTPAAMAEGVPSSGSSSVPNTSDNLLSAGEWQYWVENGVAYIAGYTNHSESSLKIPGNLGGYPVIGIGQRAFCDNSGLKSIQIHTNVTSIADDAFIDLKGLTIKAYHGAFALEWAKENNVNHANLSTEAKFASGVIDLNGLSVKNAWSNLNDSNVTFIKKEATFLRVGQVLFFPRSNAYKTGLAKTVASMEERGNTWLVSFSQPEWGDVVESLSGTDTLYLDWDNASLMNGVNIDNVVPSSSVSSEANLSIGFTKDNWKVEGHLKVEVGKVTADYKVGWKWYYLVKLPYIEYANVDMPLTFKPSIQVGYKNKDKNQDWIKSKEPAQVRNAKMAVFTIASIPAISLYGVINGYFEVQLAVQPSGLFQIEWSMKTNLNVKLQNGKTSHSFSKPVFSGTKVELSGEFKFGPQLQFYFVLGWGGFSIRFVEVTGGLYLKVKGNIGYQTIQNVHSTNSGAIHGTVDVSAEASIEGKIGIIKILGFSPDWSFSLKGTLGPWYLISLHDDYVEKNYFVFGAWSDVSKSDSCVLKQRTVIFKKDKTEEKATYDVNSLLLEPSVENVQGKKFVGYYVDTKKSGLTGSDFKWNFDKDLMPYIKNNGTLYMYANYEDIPVSAAPTTPGPGPTTPAPTTTTPAPTTATPTPTPTPAPVLVSSITLDKTAMSVWTDDQTNLFVLTAIVLPDNASDKALTWESSNGNVIVVDELGQFSAINAGEAIITCRSVANPNVTATCNVTVKQHVQQVYIDGETDSLLPGETAQLRADCYPTNANNKTVSWTSSAPSIANVNENGLVTAVGYGDAVITATAKDGSNVSATFTVHVEHELALETSVINDTAILQSNKDLLIAYVSPTTGSMRRMAQGGHELQWSMVRKSGNASAEIEEIETTYTENGTTYDSSFVSLIGTDFPSAGSSVFTITCNAGPYTASVDITLNVDGTTYAERVKLNPSTFYLDINQAATIPSQPLSADGNPVPQGMQMNLVGGIYYNEHATENTIANGTTISFDESGVYTATVQYRKANISYEVPVTFYVQDADGIIHIRVDNIELDQAFVQLVQGQTYQLTATVTPNDAYNKSVSWSSSNSTIASVSSNGLITAKKAGTVAIICEANDGSGVFAMCAVSVEAYLQLDEDVVEYTVYKNANDHADLGIINLTYDSQQRLAEDGLNVTWQLTRTSGNSTDIALEEFRNAAENGVSISGNTIKLVRIRSTGDDEYTLTCGAGDYLDSCIVRIHVLDEALPDSVSLSKSTYDGVVNEIISVDLQSICNPSGTHLPESTVVTIEGNRVFLDGLSTLYSFAEQGELIFAKAGTYQADVVFAGDNYSYTCPITITVHDEDGIVPQIISDIVVSPNRLTMLVGESTNLSATVLPDNATYSNLIWSSFDTSVVSVSSNGRVTAIGSGITTVLVTAPETDIVGGCLVSVESGLTLETDELERTVFVDGTTRMTLDTIMLTEASSTRQASAPEWSLTRDSGNNLTLRAEPYETTNSSGQTLYGCNIILYSVSRTGDTVYELTCSSGSETATVMITVHAVNRDSVLPAGIELLESTFTADINELIVINPTYVCYPENTGVPNGMKISMEGDRQFTSALNVQDFFISQSMSTLSFNKAGTYHATYVMEYANTKYVIPLLFRIKNSEGFIPVQASEVKLNYNNLNMVANEIVQLEAVYSPADTTNQAVTWHSSDTSVVTVTASGQVTAIANGMATITCTPADNEVSPVTCAVTVEDYLTVIPGNTSMVLYVQGEPVNALAEAMLSVGTIERLANAGITPEWNVDFTSVSHAQLKSQIAADKTSVYVSSTALLSAGTDTYTISCTAGAHSWQQDYSLVVRNLSGTAPTAISMNNSTVSAAVNQLITIDFTPVLTPSNAQIPSNMRSTYVGLGDFYDARDYDSYVAEGDTVTVKFTKAGQYILTRRYRLGNMEFVVPCVIQVGGATNGFNLLSATEKEYTVYDGGQSGSVSTVSLSDHMVETLWGNSVTWNIERISGNSMNVALKRSGSSVEVFVVDAEKEGADVWRVTANFGGLSDSVDITLTSAQPRGPLPESLAFADDTVTGMIGTWINIPLSAACLPAGSMLPDQGDEFWSVEMDAHGIDRSVIRIENGMARFSFVESGYYTATFKYQSGNVSYSIPVYFEIRDEEDVVSKPALQLFLVNASPIVYPEGEINIAIAQAVVAETMSTSNIGASLAYMNNHDGTWSVKINTGTAASLKLVRSSANTYDLILTNIKSSGNITYTVSCKVDGVTYSKAGSLHVADSTEERPDPTLLHTSYQVIQGEQVIIDRNLYSKRDGSVLQSSSTWNPSSFLAAAGYEIKEEEDNWVVTFYKTGTYSTTVEGYSSNLRIRVPLTIQVIPAGGTITLTVLKLPAALTEIDDEAFRGIIANVVDLRGTKVTTIGSAAFMDCVDLVDVYLPASVNSIAENAFYGCLNVTFHCPSGSYAESFANAHGINVIH